MDTVRNLFDEIMETSEGFRACCVRCDDTKFKLYFNEEKNVGCCFHEGCAWSPSRGGVSARRLISYVTGQSQFSWEKSKVIEMAEDADVSLPKEFTLIKDLPEALRETLWAYAESRGLRRSTLTKMEVGYCETGRQWGYIIFPVFENGEVVYWQGRRFKKREPKFYNPRSSRKSDLVYELSDTRQPTGAVIVESIINAMTLHRNKEPFNQWAIFSIMGKSLSDAQQDKILNYEKYLNTIVVALDGDAWRETVEIGAKLDGCVPVVRIAKLPDDKDINSLGWEKAWTTILAGDKYSRKRHIEFMMRR